MHGVNGSRAVVDPSHGVYGQHKAINVCLVRGNAPRLARDPAVEYIVGVRAVRLYLEIYECTWRQLHFRILGLPVVGRWPQMHEIADTAFQEYHPFCSWICLVSADNYEAASI